MVEEASKEYVLMGDGVLPHHRLSRDFLHACARLVFCAAESASPTHLSSVGKEMP